MIEKLLVKGADLIEGSNITKTLDNISNNLNKFGEEKSQFVDKATENLLDKLSHSEAIKKLGEELVPDFLENLNFDLVDNFRNKDDY